MGVGGARGSVNGHPESSTALNGTIKWRDQLRRLYAPTHNITCGPVLRRRGDMPSMKDI